MKVLTDSERRQQRDSRIRREDEAIGEYLAQAYRSGELQSADNFGKPFDGQDAYFETPLEFRMPYKVLKNAGVVPPEVELFQRRGQITQQIQSCTDEAERQALRQRLIELEQMIALRLEGMLAARK